ncbi:MAG: spore germination protein [Acetanaerobacterium sp.]
MLKDYLNRLSQWLMQRQTTTAPHSDASKASSTLDASLDEKIKQLKSTIGQSNDIIYREFTFGPGHDTRAELIYIDGLVNTKLINECIIEPLMYRSQRVPINKTGASLTLDNIKNSLVTVGEVAQKEDLDGVIDSVLSGDTVLFVDGILQALSMSTRGWEKRSVDEPGNETVIKGPREGFTESIRTNTSLLRRKMRTPKLTFESMMAGRKTRTTIMICYIDGLADEAVIKDVRSRLQKINTDSMLSAGTLESLITGNPYSPFTTINYSEKPDVVAGRMLEGRVAILIDGSPFVLTAPMFFFESFQTAEDYYINYFFASFLRLIRYFSFTISILAPAVYVALTTFHQELIPTTLLYSMTVAREGVPFTSAMEALIMLIAFEVIREAGIRLPRPVGQAISIVGALVMGQSAVSAGLVSAPLVIVVAITAVANFVVPTQADAATLIRFMLLLLAAWMGGVGIITGLLIMLLHLSSIKSFGVPFLSPYAPLQPSDLKDSFVRAPLWMMIRRPVRLAPEDKKRNDVKAPGQSGANTSPEG